MKFLYLLVSFVFCSQTVCFASPFAIHFPPKENLSNEDWIQIQEQLRKINTTALLKDYYDPKEDLSTFEDFLQRISRGVNQVLIDPEKGFYPIKQLKKIGEGGPRCIVTCAPYNHVYPHFVRSLEKGLEQQGFNGHLLYYIGGFPNPTGEEIQHIGVPYSFKIFAMLEAEKLGFDNVLWLDSAMLPLKNPQPLFDRIESSGSFFIHGWWIGHRHHIYILPKTRQLLLKLYGVDVATAPHLCTQIFGLNMKSPITKKIIQEFYKMAKMGTPFLTCFPEEAVLTAIIHSNQFMGWRPVFMDAALPKIIRYWTPPDTLETIHRFQQEGYFFFSRNKHLIEGFDNL